MSNKILVENNQLTELFDFDVRKILTEYNLKYHLKYHINWKLNDKVFPNQPSEYYFGCREYKRHIIDETDYPANVNKELVKRKYINKKATQLLFRLNEGCGRALYIIGIEDNGYACGISKQELLSTLINFICMTNIIGSSHIKTFNIYKTCAANKFICTIRIVLENILDTTAIM